MDTPIWVKWEYQFSNPFGAPGSPEKASRELQEGEILEDWGSLGAPVCHENGYSHLCEMGVSIFEPFLGSRKPHEDAPRWPQWPVTARSKHIF